MVLIASEITMPNPDPSPKDRWEVTRPERTGAVLATRLPTSVDRIFREATGKNAGWFVRFALLQFLEAQGLLPEDSPYLPWVVGGDGFAIAATEDQALEPANQKRLNHTPHTSQSE